MRQTPPAVLLEIAQVVSSTFNLKELLKIISQRSSLATAQTHETATLADAQHRQ